MHIHGSPLSVPLGSLLPTQATQQAMATSRAAAAVRGKLSEFAASEEDESPARVEAQGETDPDRRQKKQPEEDAFRSVFVSVSA